MDPIGVTLWKEQNGWWTACLVGKASPILRPVPGNTSPARRAEWRSQAEAEAELPALLGHPVEVVRVYGAEKD